MPTTPPGVLSPYHMYSPGGAGALPYPVSSPPRPAHPRYSASPARYSTSPAARAAAYEEERRAREESVREIGAVLQELRRVKCDLAADNSALQRHLREKEAVLFRDRQRGSPAPAAASPSAQQGVYAKFDDPYRAGSVPPTSPPVGATTSSPLQHSPLQRAPDLAGTSERWIATNQSPPAPPASMSPPSTLAAHAQLLQKDRELLELRTRMRELELRAASNSVPAVNAGSNSTYSSKDASAETARKAEAQAAQLRSELVTSQREVDKLRRDINDLRAAQSDMKSVEGMPLGRMRTTEDIQRDILREAEADAREEAAQTQMDRQNPIHSSVAQVEEHTAEMHRLERKIMELEKKEFSLVDQRDNAQIEAIGLRSRVDELQREIETIRNGELAAAEMRSRREGAAAAEARRLADDAQRGAADAMAETEKLRRQVPNNADGGTSVELSESRANILAQSWKYEAGELISQISKLRTTNKCLETAVMSRHDPLRNTMHFRTGAAVAVLVCAIASLVAFFMTDAGDLLYAMMKGGH